MSYFLFTEEGKPLHFKEYFETLNEAVRPNKTKYGTNDSMDDGVMKSMYNTAYTFFKHEDHFIAVLMSLEDGTVAFGTSNTHSTSPRDYDQSPKAMKSGFKVFGKVFYVLIEMIKKHKPKEIEFDGASPALDRLYGSIVKNKAFQKELEKIGYRYRGELAGVYYIDKK